MCFAGLMLKVILGKKLCLGENVQIVIKMFLMVWCYSKNAGLKT